MALLFIIAAAVVLVISYFWSTLSTFWSLLQVSKSIPGPSMLELYNASQHTNLLAFFEECRQKHGSVFRIWFGMELDVLFSDPDDIKTILSSATLTHKSYGYDTVRPWLRNGLLTNGGDDWHQKRKLLTPAFHFKVLSSFKEPMEECCDILVGRLNKVADGQAVDIYSYITLFALDVICETAMGIKMNAQLNQESKYVQATQKICHILHRQLFSLWKRNPFLYQFSSDKKSRDAVLETLHGETKRVIKLRRSQMDSESSAGASPAAAGDQDDGIGGKRRVAFLDSLLLAQRESGLLTDENIQEEVDTFMFEGHDTSSSAIAFAVYLLATNPDVQRRAYEEVSAIDEMDVAQSIPYLEAVIKETERLYPSVPLFSRQTKQTFQVGNLTLPPGTTISLNVYIAHRDPKSFPEPNVFRPERHLNTDATDKIHPFAYVPFSAGPRNCIGQKFAMLELKCTLRRLLREFEFRPVEGFEPNCVPEIVLKSSNGLMVRLSKRA